MLPLRSLVENDTEDAARPVVIGIPPARLKAANSNLRPLENFWEEQEREFAHLSKEFVARFHDKDLGARILDRLPEIQAGPHILRFYAGINSLLKSLLAEFRDARDYGVGLETQFVNAETIALFFMDRGLVPNKPGMDSLVSDVFPDFKDRDANTVIFNTYEHLQTALPRRNEMELRELLIRFQRWYGIGGDTALLPLEKFDGGLANKVLEFFKILYGAYLRRDFDEALDEHSRRQRRFAPKKSGGVYKQVKLQLHEDLIPVLSKALAGGNRNAFIEEAIVEKLQREGVEFDLPDQPPLPGG
ncbi:hypothetical protein [Roseovarius amoyensis]|uniref:hypothetical protein n=1 Tax=Roseovarius amoyensis TaxID=2211448 RepID=UPI0013A6963F|nr:hypothetical protein [Roseovarius amoyensis]